MLVEARSSFANQAIARHRALHSRSPLLVRDFCTRIRQVVMICSSSRGGSSMLAEVLRSSGRFLHLRGEINPFLFLCGLTAGFDDRDSDALAASDALQTEVRMSLDRELALDCGTPSDDLASKEARWRFAHDLTIRLGMQWPALAFDVERVAQVLEHSLRRLTESHGWQARVFRDPASFHRVFLHELRQTYPEVDPGYYDLGSAVTRRHGGATTDAMGPPSPFLIEEPPFITITPWQLANEEALASQPLIIKTPSNAYRLPFWRALFANAHLRIIHLTRGAAATINGLYDGWCSPGFFAHEVPLPLHIAGYSDRFPAWGTRWWKFDMPPTWQRWSMRPLQEVCRFQWQAANESILAGCAGVLSDPATYLRIRYESLTGPEGERIATLRRIMAWLGGTPEDNMGVADRALPVVMATETPYPGRWRQRSALIAPLLQDEELRLLMEHLGYHGNPSAWD